MPEPKTVEDVTQMDTQYKSMLLQLLQSQGYREIMAANIFGDAIKYVPDLEHKQVIASHVVEELEHYEEVDKLYASLDAGPLAKSIADRLAKVPYPVDWFELAMVQFLYDRAGEFHLREYEHCTFVPYRKIIGKILEEEEGHEGFGEQVLRDTYDRPENRARVQALFEKWLPIAMLSFGRPGTDGNRYAVEVGLKKRTSDVVMQDFINDIKPTVAACDLTFPPHDQIGVEVPAGLDLTL